MPSAWSKVSRVEIVVAGAVMERLRVSPPEVRWLVPLSKRVTVKVPIMPAMAVVVPVPVKVVLLGSVVLTVQVIVKGD